jgi:electron transfer flavoprotein beta subunit
MKTIVFLKQIKYVYAQTGTDPKKNFIGPDDIISMTNPLDELAVEEALRIREREKDGEVIVLSLGDRFAEEGLRRCLSMGADRAIHIEDEEYEKRDAWATATILAASLKDLHFDLIFCGREAADDQAGLVGSYIAEILKNHHITRAVRIEVDCPRKLLLQRGVERGNRELMECSLPALVTVEKGMNLPRYPTLPGILRAQSRVIDRWRVGDLGMDSIANSTEIVSLSPPKPKAKAKARKRGSSQLLPVEDAHEGGDSKKEDSKVLGEFDGS